jgi:hypothetical protein
LSAIYPEVTWETWKFNQVYKGFWDNQDNVKQFFQSASLSTGLNSATDWLNVSAKYFASLKGKTLLKKSGGFKALLMKYFPKHNWNARTTNPVSKSQFLLYKYVKSLFNGKTVILDYNKKQADRTFIYPIHITQPAYITQV